MYNKKSLDENDVINVFGMITKEHYSVKTVEKVAKSLEKGGHSVKIIEGGMNFIETMKDFMPKVVSGERPGMVFNMASSGTPAGRSSASTRSISATNTSRPRS